MGKKIVVVGLVMILSMMLIACNKDGMENTRGYKLLYGKSPKVERRCAYVTEGIYLISFDVLDKLKEDEEKDIVDTIEKEINSVVKDKDAEGLGIGQINAIFYEGDGDKVVDKFIYKDGKRVEATEADAFLPSNRRN